MARFRACRHCGELHQLGRWPHNCKDEPWPRSDHPAPYVISDMLPGGVNGLFHHAALLRFDSKHRFREATRAHGCVELGNELAAATTPRADIDLDDRVIESAINDALHEVAMDDGKGDEAVTVVAEQNIGRGIWKHGH